MMKRNVSRRASAGNRARLLLQGAVVSALLASSAPIFATGNDMSGTCLNDVGRGAALWGTSSEVTTYSEPYLPYKTPEIYRIPVTSEQASQPPETANEYVGHTGDAMERLTESGTIFGTDGKLYEYTYVRGSEPRRVVETRRVQKGLNNWVDEQVEHIEWRPVLIRVLRPAGTNMKLEEQEAALRNAANTPAPCAPLSPTPEPCEPLGSAERQTYADPGANAATAPAPQANSAPATSETPPVEGSSTVVAPKKEEASVRTVTPSANVRQNKPRPVLVLPEEARRNAQKAASAKAATTKTANQKTAAKTVQSTNQRQTNQGASTPR